MNYDKALKDKMRAEAEYQEKHYSEAGGIGQAGCAVSRPSLQERIESQLNRAHIEARKVSRLQELSMLLHNHPEVARIFDLLEEVLA